MARVKRAVNAHKKRRVVLERASGYRGQRSRLYRKAKEQVTHSLVYAYRDRKKRKGDFRQLWIQRINAAARQNGMTYNRFIQGLKAAGVEVDRKVLADLAVNDAAAFSALVEVAKAALPADVNAPGRRRRTRPPPDDASAPGESRRNPMPPVPLGPELTSIRSGAGAGGSASHQARLPGPRGPLPRRGPAGRPRGGGRPGTVTRAVRHRARPPTRHAELLATGRRAAGVAGPPGQRRGDGGHRPDRHPAGARRGLPRCSTARSTRCSRRPPAAGRRAGARPRPRQRRHGPAHGRRGRRRRRAADRRQRRPLQRQVRAGHGRQPLPPAGGRRACTWRTTCRRCARPGLRVLAADGARRPRPGRRRPTQGLLAGPTAWVFGNEAWGLPEETRALADAVVKVPIHGRAESLNLATAAAVCLYASARAQRARTHDTVTPFIREGPPAGR